MKKKLSSISVFLKYSLMNISKKTDTLYRRKMDMNACVIMDSLSSIL